LIDLRPGRIRRAIKRSSAGLSARAVCVLAYRTTAICACQFDGPRAAPRGCKDYLVLAAVVGVVSGDCTSPDFGMTVSFILVCGILGLYAPTVSSVVIALQSSE
jgi:hypothetical protein